MKVIVIREETDKDRFEAKINEMTRNRDLNIIDIKFKVCCDSDPDYEYEFSYGALIMYEEFE